MDKIQKKKTEPVSPWHAFDKNGSLVIQTTIVRNHRQVRLNGGILWGTPEVQVAKHLMLDAGSFINPKNTPYIALSNRPYQWYLTPSFYLKMEKQSTSTNDIHFQSDSGRWNNLPVTLPYYYLKSLKENSYQTPKINMGLKPFWNWDSNRAGRDSIVSIAPHYRLDGPGKEPCGAKFSAHIQTSPGAHPSS
jgi:hypothetical protein